MSHVNYGARRVGDLKISRDEDERGCVRGKIERGKTLVADRA